MFILFSFLFLLILLILLLHFHFHFHFRLLSGPGGEWNVPVALAHPKASLYLRLDERAGWTLALNSLDSMILQGR